MGLITDVTCVLGGEGNGGDVEDGGGTGTVVDGLDCVNTIAVPPCLTNTRSSVSALETMLPMAVLELT